MAICEKCKNYEKEIQGCLYMDADCVNGSMFELHHEKIKAIRPQIIVTGTVEKPYYEILYYDTSDNVWHIGYSSYNLANVIKWKEEWFEVVGEIENMQTTADVEEVKHGEWVDDMFNDGHKICSVCEEYPATDEDGNPFEALKGYQPYRCPNCGAKMRGETNVEID